jgi:hypothetical protein
VIQCLFIVFIVYKINYFCRHRETTSSFTIYILAIITVSLTLGICEAVLVIIGSKPHKHPVAFKIMFNYCWLGILTLSQYHSLLTFIAAWVIAAKYHGVAKQIDAVLRQGILI